MCAQMLSEAEVSEVQTAIESFSQLLEAQDFDNWSKYWAEDGVLMPPGHPRVVGRKAIVDYIRENFGDVQTVALSDWQVFGDSGLAIVSTNVAWTTQANPTPSAPEKQVIVARKDDGGNWQWKIIIFNAGV